MQSEYQALCAGMQEIVWLRGCWPNYDFGCATHAAFPGQSMCRGLGIESSISQAVQIKYYRLREHVDPDGEFQTARIIRVRTGDLPSPDLLS